MKGGSSSRHTSYVLSLNSFRGIDGPQIIHVSIKIGLDIDLVGYGLSIIDLVKKEEDGGTTQKDTTGVCKGDLNTDTQQ